MLWSRKKPKEPKRHPDGLPPMPETVCLARTAREVDWKRLLFLCLGGVLFALVYFSPPWPSALNADGSPFPLTPEGKASLALLTVTVFLVFLTINWMMNVAVVAIAIPVGLAVALRAGISPEVMLFALLAVAGTPFILLYGSAPNVIAYGSGQFSQAEFFRVGVGATLLFALVLALFLLWVWPPLGLPLLSGP